MKKIIAITLLLTSFSVHAEMFVIKIAIYPTICDVKFNTVKCK